MPNETMFTMPLSYMAMPERLLEAYEQINKESVGIDEVDYRLFEENLTENLRELSKAIVLGRYAPEPIRKIEIDKPDSEEKRSIGLSTLKDKIVQRMLYDALNPYFDKQLSDKSYAYRPGRSTITALNRVTDFLNRGNRFVLKSDIDDFFEEIDHDLLLSLLDRKIKDKSITRLISLFMQVGGFWETDYRAHESGVYQGDILSPLLSNIYLDQMDRFLEKRETNFVRYADDFVILCKTKQEAYSARKALKAFLPTIKLRLNKEKTYLVHIQDGFRFLGIYFYKRERQIDPERFEESLKRMRALAGTKLGFADFIKDVNHYLNGLKNYYLKILSKDASQYTLLQNTLIDTLSHKVYLSKKNKTIKKKSLFRILLEEVDFWILFEDKPAKYIELTIDKGYERYLSERSYKDKTDKLKKKKNLYAKKFANDATLHVATPGLTLGISKGKFTVKKYGRVQKSYPVSKVKRIILEGKGFSLSSNVIRKCADEGIAIDLIGKDLLPYASITTYKASTTQMIKQQAMLLNTPQHLQIATAFIQAKAKNQINYIKYLNKYHKILQPHIKTMQAQAAKIAAVKDIEMLMGYEGSISVSYWTAVAKVLDVPFEKRVTLGARDIVNSSLNYGYAILYGVVQHALVQAGLSLNISYLHALDGKKPTLTFDLIEEFRSFVVDRSIVSMLNKNEPITLDSQGLLTQKSRKIIASGVKERLGSYTMHKKESRKVENIILSQAYRLAEVVQGEKKRYKPFIGKY